MTPAGGEFATARKGITPDGLRYAERMLRKGFSFQAASSASGISETALRYMLIAPTPRPPFVMANPPRPAPPAAPKPQCPLGACAPETKTVIVRVAQEYDVTLEELASERKWRRLALARQAAYAAVHRERPGLTIPEISRIFGGRDHTTVLYGIRKHEAREAWAAVMFAFADFAPAEWKVAA